MPYHFSRKKGAASSKTLFIDEYVEALHFGKLTPEIRELGFKTFTVDNKRPPLNPEDDYIAAFCALWPTVQEDYSETPERVFKQRDRPTELNRPRATDVWKTLHTFRLPLVSPSTPETPSTPLSPSFVLSQQPSPDLTFDMAVPNRRPSLLVNGLPSVQEDTNSAANTPTAAHFNYVQAASTSTNATQATTSTTTTTSPSRDAAKLNMLRRMRPPPFQYAWTMYHDRHSEADNNYEGRLTVMLEGIITIKPFWEAFNLFPLQSLRMKDAVHFFKRGVRPVWEDPRNVHGGGWTFRVQKDRSEALWKEVLLLAVGEQFADVIQPKDDLCGLSFSIRFNSNLITIWNRDGKAQGTIDGILATVLDKVSPDLRPKDGSYYYKRHAEHQGYAEALAKANAEAEAKKSAQEEKERVEAEAAKEVVERDGKIETAKVSDGEAERVEAEEDEQEMAELQKAGLTLAE